MKSERRPCVSASVQMIKSAMTFDPDFDLSKFQAPDRSFPDGRYHLRVVDKETGACELDLTFATEEEARAEALAIRNRDERKAAIVFAPNGKDLGVFLTQTAEDVDYFNR